MEGSRKSPCIARLTGVERHFVHGWRRRVEPVLTGVDLVLEAGRCVGLAGPNGAGKSTLLRLVAGLDTPSRGTVEVGGHDARATAARRQVGYLGEESPFPRELTARDALGLLAALQGLPAAGRSQLVDVALQRVGLGAAATKRLGRFSRGMLRRFGLAQAFLGEPTLVLLDEPTAGLDAPGYPILLELVGAARARGACVVLSSHLLSDLGTTCDVVHVLFDGTLACSGAPDDIAPRGLGVLYEELAGPPVAPEDR